MLAQFSLCSLANNSINNFQILSQDKRHTPPLNSTVLADTKLGTPLHGTENYEIICSNYLLMFKCT